MAQLRGSGVGMVGAHAACMATTHKRSYDGRILSSHACALSPTPPRAPTPSACACRHHLSPSHRRAVHRLQRIQNLKGLVHVGGEDEQLWRLTLHALDLHCCVAVAADGRLTDHVRRLPAEE